MSPSDPPEARERALARKRLSEALDTAVSDPGAMPEPDAGSPGDAHGFSDDHYTSARPPHHG